MARHAACLPPTSCSRRCPSYSCTCRHVFNGSHKRVLISNLPPAPFPACTQEFDGRHKRSPYMQSAFGFALYDPGGRLLLTGSGALGMGSTANQAEYVGLIEGLKVRSCSSRPQWVHCHLCRCQVERLREALVGAGLWQSQCTWGVAGRWPPCTLEARQPDSCQTACAGSGLQKRSSVRAAGVVFFKQWDSMNGVELEAGCVNLHLWYWYAGGPGAWGEAAACHG